MSFFRDFSCGFGVPSTCRDPQGEMMCASTSFQSRKRLGKSMGFRIPARSGISPAAGAAKRLGVRSRPQGPAQIEAIAPLRATKSPA